MRKKEILVKGEKSGANLDWADDLSRCCQTKHSKIYGRNDL